MFFALFPLLILQRQLDQMGYFSSIDVFGSLFTECLTVIFSVFGCYTWDFQIISSPNERTSLQGSDEVMCNWTELFLPYGWWFSMGHGVSAVLAKRPKQAPDISRSVALKFGNTSTFVYFRACLSHRQEIETGCYLQSLKNAATLKSSLMFTYKACLCKIWMCPAD